MKALVLEQPQVLVYKEVPQPELGSEDVLIKVKACGICGSDIHGLDGSTGRRIPPLIMGHEAAGMIAQTGSGVTGWQPGDRVTFDSTIYCGKCYYCQHGYINLCDNRRVVGVSCADYHRDGAFAEYVAVPQHVLHRLPDELSFEHAAMVEPLAVAFHAVNITSKVLNDSVVVVGAGLIGLLVIQALRASGCGEIIAVDLDQDRLNLACRLGADQGLLSNEADVSQRILDCTGGAGADLAFEVVGATPTVELAVASVRKGGTVTLVGNLAPSVDLALQSVVTRGLTLLGSAASCGEYPAALQSIARGIIDVDSLISASAPLAQGALWFDQLTRRGSKLLKVILVP